MQGPGNVTPGIPITAQIDAGTFASVQSQCKQGVCYLCSQVTLEMIHDGASNTYMVGEKYLNPYAYFNGQDGADNESLYSGFNNDNHRSGYGWTPLQDRYGYANCDTFGSAHSGSFNMVFCDGSVHGIAYAINLTVHTNLSCINDGQAVNASQY